MNEEVSKKGGTEIPSPEITQHGQIGSTVRVSANTFRAVRSRATPVEQVGHVLHL